MLSTLPDQKQREQNIGMKQVVKVFCCHRCQIDIGTVRRIVHDDIDGAEDLMGFGYDKTRGFGGIRRISLHGGDFCILFGSALDL